MSRSAGVTVEGEPTRGTCPALRARLLGEVVVAIGDRAISPTAWQGRAARSLLLLLLSTPGHRLPRDQILDALWPELPPESALNALYKALSALRRVLEPGLASGKASAYVAVGSDAVWLIPESVAAVDADQFGADVAAATRLDPPARRERLRNALARYGGDLLATERYADWPVARREHLRAQRERSALDLAELDLAAGEPLGAVPALEELVADDPTVEEVHRALMRAFAAGGQRGAALRSFDRCRAALSRELGIEPAAETTALRDAIAATAETIAPPPTLSGPGAYDLLPAPLTPLVGRDREVDDLLVLLERSDVRLVTLTGPGGIGKTRLAIAVADALRDRFSGGVVFVQLGAVVDAGHVLGTVARSLGIPEQGDIDGLRAALRDRSVLIVLDTFERVLEAGAEVAGLLAVCPGLTALVTSRQALHVRGEHERVIAPLAVPTSVQPPSARQLERYGATALFLQTARASLPGLAPTGEEAAAIAEICAHLDGLPLAIELAASRLRTSSIAGLRGELAHRLDVLVDGPRDLPERQRTMRSAIAWSVEPLGQREAEVFRRLSVFAGGWAVEAAEHLLGADGRRHLAALGDRHLVARPSADGRWGMLDTIREYAGEVLREAGEHDAARDGHAAWCLCLAEANAARLAGADQSAAVEGLGPEEDNLRAALDWLLGGEPARNPEVALRLCAAIWRLWDVRGDLREGRVWIERALAASPNAPRALRGSALTALGRLADRLGDPACARAALTEAIALLEDAVAPRELAVALDSLGNVLQDAAEFERAVALHERARDLYRTVGDALGGAGATNNLGSIAYRRGDRAAAAAAWEEGVAMFREAGHARHEAMALNNLAVVTLELGDGSRSRELHERSLAIRRRLDDRAGMAASLVNIAQFAYGAGDLVESRALHEEAIDLLREIGDEQTLPVVVFNLGCMALDEGDHTVAGELLGEGLRSFAALGHGFGIVAAVERLAALAIQTGDAARAATLAGAAEALRERHELAREPLGDDACARDAAAAREALGDAEFSTAWTIGAEMGLEEVVAFAGATVAVGSA